jgi:hypothetical protein
MSARDAISGRVREHRVRRLAIMALTCALAVAATPAAASAEPACGTGAHTFSYLGEQQCYLVPAGVHELHVTAIGGRGGEEAKHEGIEGLGAVISGEMPVIPGEVLYVEVGGNGRLGGAGGFGGGGAGGAESGGGGGASDIRTCSAGGCPLNMTDTRLIVAGGGGGAGLGKGPGGDGGAGGLVEGGSTGQAESGAEGAGGRGGGGGGLESGGEGGEFGAGVESAGVNGSPGTLGLGGASAGNAGGGGGGYFGGGGGGSGATTGGNGGGGAGSSHAAQYITDVTVATASAGVEPTVAIEPSAYPSGPEGGAGKEGAEGGRGAEGQAGAEGQPGGTGAEGAAGATGRQGAQGQAGATGAEGMAGPPGAIGANGAVGPRGPAGKPGATGPAGRDGPAGRPARVEVLLCGRAILHAGRQTRTCRIATTKAPFKLVGDGEKIAVALTRGKATYARGFELGQSRGGGIALLLRPRRGLISGRYTLTLKRAHAYLREHLTLG